MNLLPVFLIIGNLLILISLLMLVPTAIALYHFQRVAISQILSTESGVLVLSFTSTLVVGYILKITCRRSAIQELGIREGFATVTLGWITMCFFSSLPFYLSGICPSMVDAYFETMSGFTTTGASIMRDVEKLPRGILFWRSFTQWIGGMGIVALSVAILPILGAGGYHLLRAEVPGGAPDRLTPRIAETAKKLWLIYIVLSLLLVLLLISGGMTWYDAICHSCTTMSSGGFSTKNASIGHYNSAYLDGIITLFMFLGGCNFVLHYHLLCRGDFRIMWRNTELRWFICIILVFTVLITSILYSHGDNAAMRQGLDSDHQYDTLPGAFRYSIFQVIAIVTSTGYATANYDIWPVSCRYLLFLLMFVGGCAGSTSGSIKVFRLMILFKVAWREIYQLINPREIVQIKIAGNTIAPHLVSMVVAFFIIYMGLFAFFTLVVTMLGVDLVTAFSSVATCMGNVGPGLAKVGPYENFAWMSPACKSVLILCMLIGRLEIYSVLVLLFPSLWKRY